MSPPQFSSPVPPAPRAAGPPAAARGPARVSPLLAYDTKATIAEAKRLFDRAGKPNIFIKIPGTKEGLPAIEESIFSGVSVNVTLLFSGSDYLAAAEAYMKGLERRVAAGLS